MPEFGVRIAVLGLKREQKKFARYVAGRIQSEQGTKALAQALREAERAATDALREASRAP